MAENKNYFKNNKLRILNIFLFQKHFQSVCVWLFFEVYSTKADLY